MSMPALRELNGEEGDWPELDSAVELPRAEDLHTDREYAQAYATIAIHHGQTYKNIVHALEYLRGHLVGARGEAAMAAKKAAEAADGVRLLREAIEGKKAAEALGLPPMRPEAPSTVEMAESIKKKISGEFGKIALETKGPHVETDPRRLVDVVGKAIDEEMARREAAQKAKRDADELDARRQADVDRKKRNRKYIKLAVAAFVTSAAGGFGTWTWGKAQGHLEAHAEAVDEVKKTIAAQAVATTMAAPPKAPAK